ncbi:MAG: hypothetical protein LBG84_10560 [Treponema sp.]|nr:hypothetical protein [Treponema sp.]
MRRKIYALTGWFVLAAAAAFGQAPEGIRGTWVNERGATVVIITAGNLDIAENVLRWGNCTYSGHRAIPEEGVYRLNIYEKEDGTVYASELWGGNRWGGSRIEASFSLDDDGMLTITIENSAHDNTIKNGEYNGKQTFRLRKKA